MDTGASSSAQLWNRMIKKDRTEENDQKKMKTASASARVCLYYSYYKKLPSLHVAQGKSPSQPNHHSG